MVCTMAVPLMISIMCNTLYICVGAACNGRATSREVEAEHGAVSSSSKPTLDQYIADARKKAEELKEKSKCPVCAV